MIVFPFLSFALAFLFNNHHIYIQLSLGHNLLSLLISLPFMFPYFFWFVCLNLGRSWQLFSHAFVMVCLFVWYLMLVNVLHYQGSNGSLCELLRWNQKQVMVVRSMLFHNTELFCADNVWCWIVLCCCIVTCGLQHIRYRIVLWRYIRNMELF